MKKLMRKKLALMKATMQTRRPYYCEVECLELTGTQGIDTGIRGNLNTSYEIVAKTTQTSSDVAVLFGARSSATSNNISSIYPTASSNVANDFGNYNNTRQSYLPAGTFPRLKIYNSKNKRSVTNLDTGDYNEVTTTYSTAFTTPNNLHIGLKTSGFADTMVNFSGYVYACKVWDNGTLARDFIPVLDWDMTPCFYDKVSGHLYYNDGTGDFSYGREIHYVEYLEGTGTQYINTKVTNSNKINFNIQFFLESGETGSWLLGARGTTFNRGLCLGTIGGTGAIRFDYGARVEGNVSVINQLITASNSGKTLTYNGNTLTAGSGTMQTGVQILLFGFNDNGTPVIRESRIYYCKLFDNGTIVRDFYPAIDENGIGFMFDKVTHLIYDNAGTGDFLYPST